MLYCVDGFAVATVIQSRAVQAVLRFRTRKEIGDSAMATAQAPENASLAAASCAAAPASAARRDPSGTFGQTLALRAIVALTRPWILLPAFALLRRTVPIVTFGDRVVIARNLDIAEVLRRSDDFVASKVYAPQMDALDGPFVLGLDPGPQHDRELALLREVVQPRDLERIARIAAAEADVGIGASVQRAAATRRGRKRIDVVPYARAVAVRVIAEYFGVPGARDLMTGWLHAIFHDIFANVLHVQAVHARAVAASEALGKHIDAEISTREARGVDGVKDDVLGRLLALKDVYGSWLDDATIRRNVAGMIVGTMDNTATALTLALSGLLRRPNVARYACSAARAGDVDAVRRYIVESARFDPPVPLLVRYTRRTTVLAAGTARARTIPAGAYLCLGIASALHDPDGFDEPAAFNIDHDAATFLFGFGVHRCLGAHINGVVLAELAAALLRLPGLRLAKGSAGSVRFDGTFPRQLLVEWT
jgi:cytochrome P450